MSRRVQIIGIPYGHGGVGEGCKLGPDAIRQAGLKEHVDPEENDGNLYIDGYVDGEEDEDKDLIGDIGFDFEDEKIPDGIDELVKVKDEKEIIDEERGYAKHLDEIVQMWNDVARVVAECINEGDLPLILGGDHTIATGTMRGAARGADGNIGVIWLDAHGDYNTPMSSPSGNVHGMPLAAALGRDEFEDKSWAEVDNLKEKNVALVGLRELDHDLPDWVEDHEEIDESEIDTEAEAIASDLQSWTMADIDKEGLDDVMEKAIDVATREVNDEEVDGVHVSVDLDWLDSSEVSGVGTPVSGGATLREARRAMEILAEKNEEEDFIRSIEFVETNPLIDMDGNRTAEIAAQLAGVTFGEQFIYE